jgi:hypothetical protein
LTTQNKNIHDLDNKWSALKQEIFEASALFERLSNLSRALGVDK